MLDQIIRGSRANKVYISEDCFLGLVIQDHIDMLKQALKYCNHSKKISRIKKKIHFFENVLTIKSI